MIEAGVPVIPGGKEAVRQVQEAKAMAERIGFPVMIKASSGGGGKGMRISRSWRISRLILRMPDGVRKGIFR